MQIVDCCSLRTERLVLRYPLDEICLNLSLSLSLSPSKLQSKFIFHIHGFQNLLHMREGRNVDYLDKTYNFILLYILC